MNWLVRWDERAYDDLDKIDAAIAKRIVKKVESYLVQDPIALGKALSANLSGLYSYRFGDYRVIYQILQDTRAILILHVGHRRDVYDI